MKTPEQAPTGELPADFLEMTGFDVDAAFQEATQEVLSNAELAIDEKVRRMEVILSQSASEAYREFVDFRSLAAQMQMACAHDHSFGQAAEGSETLGGFLQATSNADELQGHGHLPTNEKAEESADRKTKPARKKKKKTVKSGWFKILFPGTDRWEA